MPRSSDASGSSPRPIAGSAGACIRRSRGRNSRPWSTGPRPLRDGCGGANLAERSDEPPGRRALFQRRSLHDSAAFAETDARKAVACAIAAEDDLVAVLKEAALLTARQFKRLASARREFEEAAPALAARPGCSTGTNQIADHQIAAITGVMRQHLGDRPIHVGEGSATQA